MSNLGKCAKCGETFARVRVEDIDIYVGEERRFGGISYFCMECNAVISVSLDPIVLKGETVGEILQALGKPDIQLV